MRLKPLEEYQHERERYNAEERIDNKTATQYFEGDKLQDDVDARISKRNVEIGYVIQQRTDAGKTAGYDLVRQHKPDKAKGIDDRH